MEEERDRVNPQLRGISLWATLEIHGVRKKWNCFAMSCNFVKSQQIFTVLSLLESTRNLQQRTYNIFHHTLTALRHYLGNSEIHIILLKLEKIQPLVF